MTKGITIKPLLKQIAARLPHRYKTELKRIYFAKQIKEGNFVTDEPEYKILRDIITPGDWVIDIGANVGHYTKRFSELVGASGRVIAFEPVQTTFSLLSANVQLFAHQNVSLINAAVSDKLDVIGMSVPTSSGWANYYLAHISTSTDSEFSVLTMSIDSLCMNKCISLVKVDAEGHESFVLAGMRNLIEASHPVLIVETGSKEVIADLSSLGYVPERLSASPNVLFKPKS